MWSFCFSYSIYCVWSRANLYFNLHYLTYKNSSIWLIWSIDFNILYRNTKQASYNKGKYYRIMSQTKKSRQKIVSIKRICLHYTPLTKHSRLLHIDNHIFCKHRFWCYIVSWSTSYFNWPRFINFILSTYIQNCRYIMNI